jgi:hypothetical protein
MVTTAQVREEEEKMKKIEKNRKVIQMISNHQDVDSHA